MIEPSFTVDGQVVDAELFDAADPEATQQVIVNSIHTERMLRGSTMPVDHMRALARLIVGDIKRAGYTIVKRRAP